MNKVHCAHPNNAEAAIKSDEKEEKVGRKRTMMKYDNLTRYNFKPILRHKWHRCPNTGM